MSAPQRRALATLCRRWHERNAVCQNGKDDAAVDAWTDEIDDLEAEIGDHEAANGRELLMKLSVLEERIEEEDGWTMTDADDRLLRSIIADLYRIFGPR